MPEQPSKTDRASTTLVNAKDASIAAAGNIENNKITINKGLDEEGLRQLLWEWIPDLAARAGIPTAPLQVILNRLGEANVPDTEILARFNQIADELIQFREQLAHPQNDRIETAAARGKALALIDQGNFGGAREALNKAREAERSVRAESSRSEAELLAYMARIDHLELAYLSAAAKYAEAATLVRPFDSESEWRFTRSQADELYHHGREFADRGAIAQAITTYRHVLTRVSRIHNPLDWGRVQNDLGTALRVRGERESGTKHLEEAVSTFTFALEELTRERVPLEWAGVLTNLASTLSILGMHEADPRRLEEAAAAFRLALEEISRERAPLQWAWLQNNLGSALLSLGEREGGTERLKEAVTAFRLALEEWTRERVPLDWAMVQSNLGNALQIMGACKNEPKYLEEAIAAFRLALEELTRNLIPHQWATTHANLGTALLKLSQQEKRTDRIKEAVAVFRLALEELPHSRAPLERAQIQQLLNTAVGILDMRKGQG